MKAGLFNSLFILISVIHFFIENTSYKIDFSVSSISNWLSSIIDDHQYHLISLTYVFCSDDYLLEINQQFLRHDYFTDIITFDNSDKHGEIEGDVFVSIDRIRENATYECVDFHHELFRVLVHGLLHLLGFNDKLPEDALKMREMENYCLTLLINK